MKRLICTIISLAIVLSLSSTLFVSAQGETLTLKYDDRYVFEGKTVKSIASKTVTSYKVGYGINENSARDDAVAVIDTQNPSKIIATGTGTATVTFTDNSIISLSVVPADLTMFYLLGQSNAEGMDGNYSQSIVNEDGTAYTTFAPSNSWSCGKLTGHNASALSVSNAPSFVAASLTGTKNVLGNDLAYAPNGICDSGDGKSGIDSAIAYQWHKVTGEKAWVINAAHNGTSIKLWDPESTKENEFLQAAEVIKYAKQTAVKENKAGHYNIKHIAYIWMQGESDAQMSAKEYTERYNALHGAFKRVMTMQLNGKNVTAEYGALIQTRAAISAPMYTYNDIQLNGPRIAHYYLANEQQFSDIIMVSNIGDEWVQDNSKKETGKLSAYFKEHYPNGVLDYPTQSGYPNLIPKNCTEIHASYHFNQVGYNEIGRDSANSLAKAFSYITEPKAVKLKLLKKNGYEEYSDVEYFEKGDEFTAVPVIDYISYSAKKAFKVTLSGGIEEIDTYKYKITSNGSITYALPNGQSRTLRVLTNENAKKYDFTVTVKDSGGNTLGNSFSGYIGDVFTVDIKSVSGVDDTYTVAVANPKIAQYNTGSKKITFIGAGSTTITVTSNNDKSCVQKLSLTVNQKKAAKPGAPVLESKTENSVTLKAVAGCEYSMDKTNWQTSNVFKNLTANKDYSFYMRVAAAGGVLASDASDALTVRINKAAKPGAPVLESKTENSVTLKAVAGCEYSMDKTNWQTSNVFKNLTANKDYSFYMRVAAAGGVLASDASDALTVRINKAAKPGAPVLESKTENSVTLKAVAGCEYSMDKTNWQTSNVFKNLTANKDYSFYMRVAAAGDVLASDASDALTVHLPSSSETLFGDCNGDEKVNLLDLIAMRKNIVKWNVTIDQTAADCNGDGKITLLDLVAMRKYLAKWNVKLGPTAIK